LRRSRTRPYRRQRGRRACPEDRQRLIAAPGASVMAIRLMAPLPISPSRQHPDGSQITQNNESDRKAVLRDRTFAYARFLGSGGLGRRPKHSRAQVCIIANSSRNNTATEKAAGHLRASGASTSKQPIRPTAPIDRDRRRGEPTSYRCTRNDTDPHRSRKPIGPAGYRFRSYCILTAASICLHRDHI
jgi:hypothetical protein